MKATTYLVTAYNDGTPVDSQVREELLESAWRSFGGYTLSGPQTGAWVDDDGQLYLDQSDRLEIVCLGLCDRRSMC